MPRRLAPVSVQKLLISTPPNTQVLAQADQGGGWSNLSGPGRERGVSEGGGPWRRGDALRAGRPPGGPDSRPGPVALIPMDVTSGPRSPAVKPEKRGTPGPIVRSLHPVGPA